MGNYLTTTTVASTAIAISNDEVFIPHEHDPRSPTRAFRRTPLRAQRRTAPNLNDPRSPLCNRTPIATRAAELDPREPSEGLFQRTPVENCVDPREPACTGDGVVRTPVRRRLLVDDGDDDDAVNDDVDCAINEDSSFLSAIDFDLANDDDTETEADDEARAVSIFEAIAFRSPVIKSVPRASAFSKTPRTPSTLLRKSLARNSPTCAGSPCAVRFVASCPSSPCAA